MEEANLDPAVHVIALSGSGKGFCGGYDLVEYAETQAPNHDPSEPWDPVTDWQMMSRNLRGFMSLFHSDKPVVCKVHGFCVAGGTDMALCSDLLVIADDARIGYPPARVWGVPTSALWAFRVGDQRAKRLLFTGDLIDGRTAHEWGLAVEAHPAAELDDRFEELVERIALTPVNQLVMMKLLVNQALFAQGLHATQALGVFFDGIARHTPGGLRIPAPRGRGRLQGGGARARPAVRSATITRMKPEVAADRLRDLRSVTDAALAYLPMEDLLTELLVRVVAILEADTAAILLLDDDDTTLVARAAKGLEEEVERGVRIPVGRGFAGRIAATRQPVQIENIDKAEIINPILREKGLRSLLGVPLLVEGGVIGVMHVGTLTERKFTEDDVELLQSAGDRAALAISSRLTERERGLADALQSSLMPRLPELPAVTLAGRYLPAASAQLGGDWFDAFQLPDGRLGMAIGDVVGRGFHAAAVMGQLRSGLRAYALDGIAPSDVLERLSRLLRQLDPGGTATVLYTVLDPYSGSLEVSSAGHPPPLVMGDDREPTFLELPGSAPLGATRYPVYEEREHQIGPGSALVLYTDGLVERAGESLDAGLERLRAVVRAGPDDLEHLGDRLVDELLPDGPAEDDAALLLGRALPLERLAPHTAAGRRGLDPADAAPARALAVPGGRHAG